MLATPAFGPGFPFEGVVCLIPGMIYARDMAQNRPATLIDDNGRVCTQCGIYKTWDCYYKRKKPHGLQWYQNNCKDCFRAQANPINARNRQKIRQEVLAHYGGSCACCGEAEPVFLTLDHLNNDGAQHRRELGARGNGNALHYWIRHNGYPEIFQVLCWNCNLGKQINGVCPHMAVSES